MLFLECKINDVHLTILVPVITAIMSHIDTVSEAGGPRVTHPVLKTLTKIQGPRAGTHVTVGNLRNYS